MSWRKKLDDDQTYVIDLVQMPDGKRYLQPRLADSQPTDYTALSSKAYRGSDLTSWKVYGKVQERIELHDGSRFFIDPHGVWLTQEEAEYWKANCSQAALNDPSAPWINGLAPRFAPK